MRLLVHHIADRYARDRVAEAAGASRARMAERFWVGSVEGVGIADDAGAPVYIEGQHQILSLPDALRQLFECFGGEHAIAGNLSPGRVDLVQSCDAERSAMTICGRNFDL